MTHRAPSRPGHVAVALMIAALVDGPATVPDLAAESGLSPQSVRGYIAAMRRRRALHVAQWEHDSAGRRKLAAYAIGKKPDAPKPPQRTRAEIARDHRRRRRDARLLGLR